MSQDYRFDDKLQSTVEVLRKVYGCKTNSDVIRKAVALLKMMAEYKDDEHRITIIDPYDMDSQQVIILAD
jgi:hypothetical protein